MFCNYFSYFFLFVVSDIEVMFEEDFDIRVGVVQWRILFYQGLQYVLNIIYFLFIKVCLGYIMQEVSLQIDELFQFVEKLSYFVVIV